MSIGGVARLAVTAETPNRPEDDCEVAERAVNTPQRNPDWTRDELILALDLYFRADPRTTNKGDARIAELSSLLNLLPVHRATSRNADFRNPNGVYMKLCNFLRLDPSYTGTGLSAGALGDEQVWKEFEPDRLRLERVASAIRAFVNAPNEFQFNELEPLDDTEAPEGRILTRIHLSRERNRHLAAKKKAVVFDSAGTLICEVCGFDFGQRYGSLGKGFMECHHTIPLSTLAPGSRTRLEDLALVCANCHRMLHRGSPWPSIDGLRISLNLID